MRLAYRVLAVWLLAAPYALPTAAAQKSEGVLRLYSPATPASMSLLEESTLVARKYSGRRMEDVWLDK